MSLGAEVWRDIPGFTGYQVSDKGRIRSGKRNRPWKILALHPDRCGYFRVNLYQGEVRVCKRINVAMLEAFRGPRPESMVARHLDDDKTNNRLENLAWGTWTENRLDAVRNGTHNNSRKTHCPQMHDYSEHGARSSNGKRHCKKCARDRARAKYHALAEVAS